MCGDEPPTKRQKTTVDPELPPAPINFDFDPERDLQFLLTPPEDLSWLEDDLDLGLLLCNPGPTVTVTVISVEFTSEHRAFGTKVLSPSPNQITFTFRNDAPNDQVQVRGTAVNSQLGDATAAFQQPTWICDPTTAQNWSDPVSHDKNQQVTAKVTIRIEVPEQGGQAPSVERIQGAPVAGTSGLAFDTALNDINGLGPGEHDYVINLTSTGALDNEVKIIDESIDWKITVREGAATRECMAGQTGPHRLYLTFGAPGGGVDYQSGTFDLSGTPQHVTEERLAWAVNAVVSEHGHVPGYDPDDEKHQVDAIFLRLATLGVDYCLGFRFSSTVDETYLEDLSSGGAHPNLHHYLWMCNTGQAKGECHNIAVAFILACRIIGVTGAFDLGFVEPWPRRSDDPNNNFPPRQNDPGPALVRNASRPHPPVVPVDNYDPWIKGKYSTDHSGTYFRTVNRRANDGSIPFQYCAFVDASDFVNNFEGTARYQGRFLYAIGDVILDSETSADLNASVYYTPHVRDAQSRKVTYVDNGGKFRLVFAHSDTGLLDPTPYRQTDGNDAIAYQNVPGVGSAFWWED